MILIYMFLRKIITYPFLCKFYIQCNFAHCLTTKKLIYESKVIHHFQPGVLLVY